MATLTITLPDEEMEHVEQAAVKQGMGTAEYVRAVIVENRIFFSKAALDAELLRRMDSPSVEADDAFWEELDREVIAERSRKIEHEPKG